MAQKKQGREIAKDQSVFYGGQFYTAGDEDALHAAASKKGAEPLSVDHLSAHGVAFGFGKAKALGDADLEADPTLRAGEADEVLAEGDEDEGAVSGEMTETEHTPGLYAGQKGSTGPKPSGRGAKGSKK